MPDSHYFSGEATFLDASALRACAPWKQSIEGLTLQFLTAPHVFSKSYFDAGSLVLLETFLNQSAGAEAASPARIGDLGCGYGAIGAFLAAFRPDSLVFSGDINPRAVQLCQENYRFNALKNGFAWCGDGFDALRSESLDAIFFNPPVRAGNAAIAKLFGDCERVLKSGGALWVVLRTAQGAKTWAKKLEIQFGNCQTLQISRGYRILLIHKQ